jgi:hypothetical protein
VQGANLALQSSMKELFLKVDGVGSEEQAIGSSIGAALQRNRVYKNDEHYEIREQFRSNWADLIRKEAKAYGKPLRPISDEEHCAAIERICGNLSAQFGEILSGGRLRFGTSQKAFNLYLKYLWALGEIERPPHCPIDSIILARIGFADSWTKSDSPEDYMRWINKIREQMTLADWENDVWLRWRLANPGV